MGGGRQRGFDKAVALDQAMRVFWVKGYAGSSMADLTTAMGINKPSLYAAFGNKEELFAQATHHYNQEYAAQHFRWLKREELSIKERLKHFMLSIIEQQASEDTPPGCFMSVCSSELVSENIPDQAMAVLQESLEFTEQQLKQFFAQAIPSSSPERVEHLTLYVMMLLQGSASLTRGEKTVAELLPVVEIGLGVIEEAITG